MIILTLNCGSSSLKYQVYNWATHNVLGKGVVERIGQNNTKIKHQTLGKEEFEMEKGCPTHKEAIAMVLETLVDSANGCLGNINEVTSVGHRMVHGSNVFTKSVIITSEAMAKFKECSPLAPLHNPANILGIEAAMACLPSVTHCAIMDTAWHQTMPDFAYRYSVPKKWYTENGVRRYGFHGTSFLYTAKRAAVLLGKKNSDTNVVIAHIGNGASICAVKNGVSIDTSMGMTPTEGMVMGTRCGDLDVGILPYMNRNAKLDINQLDTILTKESGILGITERFTDRRDVEDGVSKGDSDCKLAFEMETYRIKKYIGSYIAAMGCAVDAVVFTAGVGEFGDLVRLAALEGLEHIGIEIDAEANKVAKTSNAETCISKASSKIKVFVIPTDEELVMTEDTYALVNGSYDVHTNYKYIFEDKNYVNKARMESLPKDIAKRVGLDKIIVMPK